MIRQWRCFSKRRTGVKRVQVHHAEGRCWWPSGNSQKKEQTVGSCRYINYAQLRTEANSDVPGRSFSILSGLFPVGVRLPVSGQNDIGSDVQSLGFKGKDFSINAMLWIRTQLWAGLQPSGSSQFSRFFCLPPLPYFSLWFCLGSVVPIVPHVGRSVIVTQAQRIQGCDLSAWDRLADSF
jgi:hypothetical protein